MHVVINRMHHAGMEDHYSVVLFDDSEGSTPFDPFGAFSIFVTDAQAAFALVKCIRQASTEPIKVRHVLNGEEKDA